MDKSPSTAGLSYHGSDTARPPFLAFRNVGLRYGDAADSLALDGLDMTIRRGEFAAVVGPSGCGKSSLMKLATGLLMPTSGTIAADNKPVTEPLKIVGMAFQNPTLLPWRNLLSNIMLPLEIAQPHRSRLRANRKMYEGRARNLLDVVGLTGFETKHPWMLSGGMQQRANLCRSLIHEPELLMLDEPFGALDAFTREELWGVLQTVFMQRGFTCVLVTHDLREAVFLADIVFVMSARPGKVIATHRVDLPRPRMMTDTFDPAFIEIVSRIRSEIVQIRHDQALPASTNRVEC